MAWDKFGNDDWIELYDETTLSLKQDTHPLEILLEIKIYDGAMKFGVLIEKDKAKLIAARLLELSK